MSGDAAVEAAREIFTEEGLEPHGWSNEPGYVYGAHEHPYHKVLVCTAGSITFHVGNRNITLGPGDRVDIPPRTEHSATVGPHGVTCWEAARS